MLHYPTIETNMKYSYRKLKNLRRNMQAAFNGCIRQIEEIIVGAGGYVQYRLNGDANYTTEHGEKRIKVFVDTPSNNGKVTT